MEGFEFRQCEWNACRFRFPAETAELKASRCPRCGAATTVVGEALPALPQANPKPPGASFSALLDNIRSIHNVGSIFRTADSAGLRHLYLCGITATPAHPKLAKAALGAQEYVAWSHDLNSVDLAKALKEQGYQLWAFETGKGAESVFDADLAHVLNHVVTIFGNERAGIDPGVLALCDRIFYLPMVGQKRSLNVAVAFGIVAYHMRYDAKFAGRQS